jgi:farnesyl-diphosphate farnesyltransferase
MTPSERELFGILRGVSRSFYISVRFLPERIRLTIALAYLLARASDTIADANGTEPRLRSEFLAQFLKQIRDGDFNPSLEVTPFLANQAEGPEKTLLLHINPVVQSLGLIATQHRELVAEVLSKIIHGQTLDIQRFEMRPGTQGLSDDGSLEEYTYLVAGSVGEFWTKVCLLEWRGYSNQPETKLLGLGRDFGNGLQLINILRDFPNDLRQGRSYLPVTNLEIVAADPDLARSEWERWRQRALSYLEGGWQYVNAVRPPRVRFACAVPLFIGVHTLDLLGREPKLRPGIKVSRSEVKSLMCWAAALAWFPALKGYIRQRVFRWKGA